MSLRLDRDDVRDELLDPVPHDRSRSNLCDLLRDPFGLCDRGKDPANRNGNMRTAGLHHHVHADEHGDHHSNHYSDLHLDGDRHQLRRAAGVLRDHS